MFIYRSIEVVNVVFRRYKLVVHLYRCDECETAYLVLGAGAVGLGVAEPLGGDAAARGAAEVSGRARARRAVRALVRAVRAVRVRVAHPHQRHAAAARAPELRTRTRTLHITHYTLHTTATTHLQFHHFIHSLCVFIHLY